LWATQNRSYERRSYRRRGDGSLLPLSLHGRYLQKRLTRQPPATENLVGKEGVGENYKYAETRPWRRGKGIQGNHLCLREGEKVKKGVLQTVKKGKFQTGWGKEKKTQKGRAAKRIAVSHSARMKYETIKVVT